MILLRAMAGSGVGRRVLGATRSRDARNADGLGLLRRGGGRAGPGRPPDRIVDAGRSGRAFGRALGRVAAHEIVHALLPERPHDRAGLMSQSFGRRELTASALHAHPGLRADLRRASPERVGAETLMGARKAMEGGALPAKALLLPLHAPSMDRAPYTVLASIAAGGFPTRTAGPPGRPNNVVDPSENRPAAPRRRHRRRRYPSHSIPFRRRPGAVPSRRPSRSSGTAGRRWSSGTCSGVRGHSASSCARRPGISKKNLRRVLVEMEGLGLVWKEVRPGADRKAEYALTPFGETLKPVVGAMYEWGLHLVTPPRAAHRFQ